MCAKEKRGRRRARESELQFAEAWLSLSIASNENDSARHVQSYVCAVYFYMSDMYVLWNQRAQTFSAPARSTEKTNRKKSKFNFTKANFCLALVLGSGIISLSDVALFAVARLCRRGESVERRYGDPTHIRRANIRLVKNGEKISLDTQIRAHGLQDRHYN